jgi:SRSO17 transposase
VRGLLTDGARKSMQPMAARLGVDHQALQQFITSSTWGYEAVRRNVARWAADVIAPAAYVIDDTVDGVTRKIGQRSRGSSVAGLARIIRSAGA